MNYFLLASTASFLTLLIVIPIVIFVVVFFGRKLSAKSKSRRQSEARIERNVEQGNPSGKWSPVPMPDPIIAEYKSPKGINFRSTDVYTEEEQAAIFPFYDRGFDDYLRRTANHPTMGALTEFRKHSDLIVYLIKPTAKSADDESPAFYTTTNIKSSGTCLGIGGNSDYPPSILLPVNKTHLPQIAEISRNEPEHVGLLDYERRRKAGIPQEEKNFYFYVGEGKDEHPIFGEDGTMRGLAGLNRAKKPHNCLAHLAK